MSRDLDRLRRRHERRLVRQRQEVQETQPDKWLMPAVFICLGVVAIAFFWIFAF